MEEPRDSKTHRYDKLEDRYNDKKTHDNFSHHGMRAHLRRIQKAEKDLEEGLEEYYEGDDYFNFDDLES